MATAGMHVGVRDGRLDHDPHRPDWRCPDCDVDWPCVAARERMLTTWTPVLRALTMAAYFTQACEDLPQAPAGELHRRFLGWVREA